jgi:hypothetical protein
MTHTHPQTDNSHNRCFANRHMTPEEYGVWDVCRSVSHKTGTLYFDGRTIAGYFDGTGKDVIYRIVKRLVKKGWLLVQVAGRNTRNGLYVPTQYEVLSPEQWAEDHPHDCVPSEPEESSRESQTGSLSEQLSPVVEPRLVQSGKPEQPVVISRTASRESPTGPVVIPRTTSRDSATYSAKEISLVCDSADLNVAEGNTAPSIPLRASREKPDGWLAGRLAAILECKSKVCVPIEDELRKLDALAAEYGDLAVLLGFYYFVQRDKGLTGVAWPLKLFFNEATAWIRHAVREENHGGHSRDMILYIHALMSTHIDVEINECLPVCDLNLLQNEVDDSAGAEYDASTAEEYVRSHTPAQLAADIEKFSSIRGAVVTGVQQ